MNIPSILSRIHDYKAFLTVDELTERGRALAEKYPGVVTRSSVGRSRAGDALWCLRLGDGPENALCFACPHPNEPIGALTLLSLAEILAGDPALLAETGMTWHLIPCVDPDGTRLNEGWFKGPFTIENYVRGFYRPPGSRQVEWTFPFRFRDMWFDKPIPETRALMDMIGALRPKLTYSLHNSAFGGAYWYVTKNDAALCAALEGAAHRQDLPLHLGEPESPYIAKYSKAVHSMMSLREYYEYRGARGESVPTGELSCGTCSADYIKTVCDSLVLMAELPYFQVRGIDDDSDSGMTRKAAFQERAARRAGHAAFLRARWDEARALFGADNPFPLLVDDAIAAYTTDEGEISGAEFDRPATKAEALDSLWLSRIFEALDLALAVRACNFELARSQNGRTVLEAVREKTDARLTEACAQIETACDYGVASIRRLVAMQLESVLQALPYARGGS